MNRSAAFPRALLSAALVAFAAAAPAQTPKPPPRLPPNAAESSRIPAGVDTGSPASSDTVPLGTPVPPTPGADRTEIRNRSAAARAAARPKVASSSADCTRRVATDGTTSGSGSKASPAASPQGGLGTRPTSAGSAASTPVAGGTSRIDC